MKCELKRKREREKANARSLKERRRGIQCVFEINKWKNEAIKEKAFGRVRKSSQRDREIESSDERFGC